MALQTIDDTSAIFLTISEQLLNVSTLLINRLCSNINSTETTLVKNYCKLIVNLFQIRINISDRTFLTCKEWVLKSLKANQELQNINEIFLALKQIIEIGPFHLINQDIYNLLKDDGFFKLLFTQSSYNLTESGFLAISCIEAFLKNSESNEKILLPEYKTIIANIIINILQCVYKNEQNYSYYYQAVSTCLKILSNLIDSKLLIENKNMAGDILGIIQVFICHGIKGYLIVQPKQLRPAAMVIPERIQTVPRHAVHNLNKSKLKKQQLKKKKSEVVNNSSDLKKSNKYSSDSDTSDTEYTSSSRTESMIRLAAINLLLKIIQELPPREMFGYWPQIIVSTTGTNARVLLSLTLKEPIAKLRQICLSTLAEAILEARTFLTYAEDTEHSAFLTFFGAVGAMIKQLHMALSHLLNTEKNFAVITHALKCINALVQVTPYARLASGLATKVSISCRAFIMHKDPTAKVAALSVFEAFASKDKLTSEIISILSEKSDKLSKINMCDNTLSQLELTIMNNEEQYVDEFDYSDTIISQEEEANKVQVDNKIEDNYSSENKNLDICFILHVCLENILDKAMQVPVRLQSLKLLSALVNKDIDHLVFNHIDLVSRHLVETLQETETQVALHSCRVLEKISSSLKENCAIKKDVLLNFWSIIFQQIILLVQSIHFNLREVACNCLGTINNQIYNQLPYDQNILIITTLFGAVRDEDSAVRAAALRSLGLLILLPSLEDDTGFVLDLANLSCTALEDENFGVRVKAAWALANVSDCLIKQSKSNDIESLSLDRLLPDLYKVSLKAAQDNNKVKCNALRAIGNILCLCQDLEISCDISSGIDILIKCAITGNDMKVRWNACRAIGFVISKQQISAVAPHWQDRVFPALCDLVCHSPNFKVRTNAAWALKMCESYDKYIPFLWKNIILALDNSQHVPNFVEYHHHDALVQQLCLTLGQIASHTELSDLQGLWPDIKDRIQDIMVHMKYFRERVLPEKTDDFVNAKMKLDNFARTGLTLNERNIAKILANLFDFTNINNECKF
ncbi:HEAT repeat-containing protein 6 isoform X2 [Chelonus insularis]|uniref:HEAT repeat-containing protein 6 isoform X2 n=1 Tax=Chelonus insularis TaxID=460826 RepID=UPI00158A87C5|nr:HEAT repeat-containing protein 6 isoform X2 [Chelonus insularis]